MEIPSRQKLRKRKTRRNLDDIRKRSRSETKDNAKEKSIEKVRNNEQIATKRLTLALFNKAVQSKVVTRPTVTVIQKKNVIDNKHVQGVSKNQSYKNASNFNIMTFKNINCNPQLEHKSDIEGIVVDLEKTAERVTLFSPLKYDLCEDSPTESPFEQCELKKNHEFLTISPSYSSSETEFEVCLYERFMTDLPGYLRKQFPILTKGNIANKNIAYLKQIYFNNFQKIQSNNFRSLSRTGTPLNTNHHKNSVVQNPMDYIRRGLSWQQSVKINQPIASRNSCSSSSPFASNMSEVDINEHDSPEYIYFPHKLNQ